MDALNFLKFWRHVTIAATSTTVPHLVLKTDNGSDKEDSFFDLELTVHDFDNKENNSNNNKTNGNSKKKTISRSNVVDMKQEGPSKMAKRVADDSEIYVSKTAPCVSSSEPISKRKILSIEPVPKLKSAPSFRIFMSKKQGHNRESRV